MADSPAPNLVTVLGFGSLLSQKSALSTLPTLHRFALARVFHFRRIFRHPSPIFFHRGIVPTPAPDAPTEMGSLSVERAEGEAVGGAAQSVVVAVMEIPRADFERLVEREEEYDLVMTDYWEVDAGGPEASPAGKGFMCMPPDLGECGDSKEWYVRKWGQDRWDGSYGRWGLEGIWEFGSVREILPCPVYLRHCVLAAEKAGKTAHDSFLDDSFLIDRETTIREYLRQRPDILTTLPPPSLHERYNG